MWVKRALYIDTVMNGTMTHTYQPLVNIMQNYSILHVVGSSPTSYIACRHIFTTASNWLNPFLFYFITLGIDFKQKLINLDGVPIKLQIWDTAGNCYYHRHNFVIVCHVYMSSLNHFTAVGQERFRTLTTAYYRGAMGILLMYDVTSLESYNNLSYWLRNIQEVSEYKLVMSLWIELQLNFLILFLFVCLIA